MARNYSLLYLVLSACWLAVAPVQGQSTSGSGAAVSDRHAANSVFDGHAHWYGGHFHGKRTASGAIFDKMQLTAAHPSLPFGTRVKVHSRHSGKDVVVTVTDRCPALKQRCIDVSEGAARALGIYPTAPCAVHCEVVPRHAKQEVAASKGAGAAADAPTRLAKAGKSEL